MSHCTFALLHAAENGDLVITARPSAQIEREELSPDFWRVACLSVRRDVRRGWKVFIRPRDGVNPEIATKIIAKDYVDLTAKMSDVKRLWPETDKRMDAETRRLTETKPNP